MALGSCLSCVRSRDLDRMATARRIRGAMRRRFFFWLIFFGAAAAIPAQEGHPLTGSWHGEWHPAAGQKVPVLIYMKWNSRAIEGTINPGPKAAPLKVADLDASNWTVHL